MSFAVRTSKKASQPKFPDCSSACNFLLSAVNNWMTDCPELTSCSGVDTESGGQDSYDPVESLSSSLDPTLNQASPNSIVKLSAVVIICNTTSIFCWNLAICSLMYRPLRSVDLWRNYPASYQTRYLSRLSKLWDSRGYSLWADAIWRKSIGYHFPHIIMPPPLSIFYIFPVEILHIPS